MGSVYILHWNFNPSTKWLFSLIDTIFHWPSFELLFFMIIAWLFFKLFNMLGLLNEKVKGHLPILDMTAKM